MCLIDTEEIERVAKTHDNLKELKTWVNIFIDRLVEEGYTPILDADDMFICPALEFVKKEVL